MINHSIVLQRLNFKNSRKKKKNAICITINLYNKCCPALNNWNWKLSHFFLSHPAWALDEATKWHWLGPFQHLRLLETQASVCFISMAWSQKINVGSRGIFLHRLNLSNVIACFSFWDNEISWFESCYWRIVKTRVDCWTNTFLTHVRVIVTVKRNVVITATFRTGIIRNSKSLPARFCDLPRSSSFSRLPRVLFLLELRCTQETFPSYFVDLASSRAPFTGVKVYTRDFPFLLCWPGLKECSFYWSWGVHKRLSLPTLLTRLKRVLFLLELRCTQETFPSYSVDLGYEEPPFQN